MTKIYTQAPLPFQGQKRKWGGDFKQALRHFDDCNVFVDLFGGSGLLSHFTHTARPDAVVIYNDFDGYHSRIANIPRTNALLADLLDIFESHGIARKKLKNELQLFMQGERNVERYRDAGINWWDYCGSILVNSYPTYFEKLPPLIAKINREKRNSKNYVLFLGETGVESNQAPCLSLVQFQIDDGELVLSAYQRSSDASLGLPADIYHLYLMARQIELPLKSITLNLGNVHIYENNLERTERLLAGDEDVKFELNV